jgi:hypothetical protein
LLGGAACLEAGQSLFGFLLLNGNYMSGKSIVTGLDFSRAENDAFIEFVIRAAQPRG